MPRNRSVFGIVLRVAVLVALVVAATWGAHMVRETLNLHVMPSNEQQVHRAIMLGSLAYVILLAVPFVPGAEIGIAMLTAFGGAIAPLVYAATVLAMMLAYVVGRFLPIMMLARLFALLRLQRAEALITRAAALPPDARLQMLLDGSPPGAVALSLRYRYLALGLALNIPGNVVIGGGGGIMMLAGLSGLFAPLPTFLTVAIAVSPVPIFVLMMGA